MEEVCGEFDGRGKSRALESRSRGELVSHAHPRSFPFRQYELLAKPHRSARAFPFRIRSVRSRGLSLILQAAAAVIHITTYSSAFVLIGTTGLSYAVPLRGRKTRRDFIEERKWTIEQ